MALSFSSNSKIPGSHDQIFFKSSAEVVLRDYNRTHWGYLW